MLQGVQLPWSATLYLPQHLTAAAVAAAWAQDHPRACQAAKHHPHLPTSQARAGPQLYGTSLALVVRSLGQVCRDLGQIALCLGQVCQDLGLYLKQGSLSWDPQAWDPLVLVCLQGCALQQAVQSGL